MRRWFLSYNSQDLLLMQALEAALRHRDAEARIFFAPKSLRVGGYWLPELAEEIAEATAFVLLVGEKGIGDWQVTEYYEAYSKRVKAPDFPLVLVLLNGQPAPGLPFLRQLHWIVTDDPASEHTLARLLAAAAGEGTRPGELWRYTAPYRGLSAMEEKDSDYFFGRRREAVEVIRTLETEPDKLPILLGNSGVGKSSLALAGVLAALARQAWTETGGNAEGWPQGFKDSRRWCVLKFKPGIEPIRALVEPFLRTWQFDPTDPLLETRKGEWIENLINGRNTLKGLLDATEGRRQQLGQSTPPAFLIYIDQGEELYARAEERQRRRFSELIAEGLADPRFHALMSLRADFFGELQKDQPLYAAHRQVNVPPLREAELREVVSRPAELLSARFETARLADHIAQRTAEESTKDAGALPLLSYLLDDTWKQMIERGDGVLRLPAQAIELGGVLVDRANAFLAGHPKSEDRVRRIFNLLIAVREGEEPTRRRACRSEFSDEEWRLVSELADDPNRLLVTATPEDGEAFAEVTHEAIFRRWEKLREWIAAEREFLAWRTGLKAACRAWHNAPEESKADALLMGLALAQAQVWFAKRADEMSKLDREFIESSVERERAARARLQRTRVLVGALFIGVIIVAAGLTYGGFLSPTYLAMRARTLSDIVSSKVLSAEQERMLKPGDTFKECSICLDMVVVPGGEIMVGSAEATESPLHTVKIASPFAVSVHEVTFDDWDACVALGGCAEASDSGWGRGKHPVINVSWTDVQDYIAWLSKQTGKRYRLLSEAEWEYAARAGSETAFPWGEEVGIGNANCDGCRSHWDDGGSAPVGSFPANKFGLFDMSGNVWEWAQDCYHDNYEGAPSDGTAMTGGDCQSRVVRSGSWGSDPPHVRSASRIPRAPGYRSSSLGIRVGRTLAP